MAEETTNNLTGMRVSTTFRGLLHFPRSIDATLSKQVVYDGVGTPTALTLGGDTKGLDINGPVSCTGNLSISNNTTIGGNTTISGNTTIGGDVSLTNGGTINDVSVLSSGSSVSLRALNTAEAGKLRIRETSSDYELLFGNPTVTDKNLFSIIVKNGTNNNLYIKNDYSDSDINSPLWINRANGEVTIKTLRVSNIKTVLPPNVSTPTGQETTYGLSNRNVIPVGMIAMFPVLGIPDGWIPCDGKQHNKFILPELFSLIGYNYSILKSGDLFQVPDYRGLFVRGLDYKRSDEASRVFIDPNTSRNLDGTIQDDDVKPHIHNLNNVLSHPQPTGTTQVEQYQDGNADGDYSGIISQTGTNGGIETRPKNVVALYCIKW